MIPEQYRLKKKSSFTATYKTGNTFHKNGLTAFCGKLKKYGNTRFGFVVSKKFHKRAVKRNRIKRLMRESLRLYIKINGKDFDTKYMSIIFVASAKLLDKDFSYINKCINEIMDNIKND